MSAIADQIAATLGVAAKQVDDSVVTCGHTYSDEAGAHSQTFEAIRGALSAAAQMALDGVWRNEAFTLTVDGTAFDYEPEEGNEVTVRQGDGETETFTIIQRQRDPMRSVCVLTVGLQYE
jgi:hypothetical protein